MVNLPRPDDGSEIPFPDLGGTRSHDLPCLKTAYPWLPQFDDQNMNSASAFSSTSTTQVSIYLVRVGDIESQTAKDYAAQYFAEFVNLQDKYDRLEELMISM